MRPIRCDWCGYVPKPLILLTAMEDYGRLCPGCYYCWRYGSPRRIDEDKPFTEEQKQLKAWSKNFFAQAIDIARICNQPLPEDAT